MTKSRSIENINLDWKFIRGEEPRAWYKGFDDSKWRNITIPHDWSVEETFSQEHSSGTGYLPAGTGWYRKTFYLPVVNKDKKVFVTFDGVYNNSQVWCNSYYIGKRPYGYSSFSYDITDFVSFGEVGNVLSVKVNHNNVADSRWFTGSGIYRDVTITITDRTHIDKYGVYLTTPNVSIEHASVAVNITITNDDFEKADVQYRNTILDHDGNSIVTETDLIAVSEYSEIEAGQVLNIKNPNLWSPNSPYMYNLLTEILKNGEVIDHVNTPFGIRFFSFDPDKGFYLNGNNLKIKGVCIHHDAGCLGAAVPEKVWAIRLADLKAMGCNAIRTSHNPPSRNFLDLCDKIGFLVMDEAFDEWEGVKNKWADGHNVYPPKHYGYYEDFPQWAETDIKDMVLRDRNHPCIMLWSIGNEVDYPNDPYCHPYFLTMTGNNDANKPEAEKVYDPNKPNAERLTVISKRLVKYVKECDTTRPVTAAIAFPELSNLTGFTNTLDIVGYNYKEHLYLEDRRKFPNRVIFGSENSSSLEAWLAVINSDFICGQFIWTGFDYLGEAKGWPIRASQSGFLDLAGYKKSGYYHRQSLWSDVPMAFLAIQRKEPEAPKGKPGRNFGEPLWNWNTGEKLEVICYTNCEEAELFINGNSLGIKYMEDFPQHYLVWETEFEEGKVCVYAKNSNGQNSFCELETVSEPFKLIMRPDSQEITADGQDVALVDIQVTDDNGRLIFNADNLIKLKIDGPGEIIGLENGDVSDLEPYSSRQRKAFHGKLLAYIRAAVSEGQIRVTANAQGLESGSVSIASVRKQVR